MTTATRTLEILRRRVPNVRVLAGGAIVAAVVAIILVTGLFGGSGRPTAAAATLADTRSSWIPGQPSLADSRAYLTIAQRAELLAGQRAGARAALLRRLAAEKKARQANARKAAHDRYLAARRAAMARYRAALRANAKARAAAAARRARQQAAYDAALRRYHHSLIIRPGRECRLPDVKHRYRCHSGLKPHRPLP